MGGEATSFRVSRRTLEVLEWRSLQVSLAERAKTSFGRDFCLNWVPGKLKPAAAHKQSQAILDLARLVADTQRNLPLSDIPDVADILRRIERSGTINVEEFGTLVRAHRASQGLHHYLQRYAGTQAASLLGVLEGIDLLDDWSRKQFPLLDSKGEIADSASEDLRALRKLALQFHKEIQDTLRDYLHNPKLGEVMQDTYVTVRDGRYVVPVKTSFRARVPGIIHDVSATEATVFIEPQEVVDSNNQLKIVEKEIQKEIERILARVVEDTKPFAPSLRKNQAILAKADLLAAAADLVGAWDGKAVSAEWVKNGEPTFTKLRHPTLSLRRKVVSNSLSWKKGLVLSGPNTGGKTVLLKSVGCAVCLAWAGLPIPAESVSLPSELGGLAADIGDDQNLERNLSTFSAHLAALKTILDDAELGDLVLIDEIATGTSPEEGEPLAQAILEHFLEKEVSFFVTTHYRGLKHFAMSDERVRIAAMAFDRTTRSPTYEVMLDIPGESSALEAAEQMGLPSDLITRARALRGEVSHDMTQAITRLERARDSFEIKERELLDSKRRVEDDSRRLREKIAEYEAKQREGLAAEAREVLKNFGALRDELSKSVKSATQGEGGSNAPALFTKLSDAAESVRNVIEGARKGEGFLPPVADADIVPDAVLEIEGLGLGTILEVPKDLTSPRAVVLVQVGELKTRVIRSRLRKPPADRVRAFTAHRSANALARDRHDKAVTPVKLTPSGGSGGGNLICDVRGKPVEEAMRRIEQQLNELFRNENAVITCIHGHGSDRLKDSIRNYLTKERGDVVYRSGTWPGEGGDGVTIIERRN
ncbi:MAG: Smr/MutS family protein [Bdellovibrionales bacterium]|nr:Smr/MutS family protein [Bdellovibrionales bacterium]